MSDTRYRAGNGLRRSAFWRVAAFATLALMMAAGVAGAHVQNAFAANTLIVNGLSLDGKPLGMWIAISSAGTVVKSGFTPLTFAGVTGATYIIQAQNYGTIFFDHWENGSTNPSRTLALSADKTITAYYRTTSTHNLVVNSAAMAGGTISGYYTAISSAGTTVKTGFTSLTFAGNHGASYTVSVSDYGSMAFDHWDNGSTARARTLALNADTTVTAYFRNTAAPATYTLTVSSASLSGSALNGYYTTISQGGTTAKTGFTPLTFDGKAGTTYTVSVSDYGYFTFDHWDNGSTARAKSVSLSANTTIMAYYKDNTPAPNNNPKAVDDTAVTSRDSSVVIAVLANDSDVDGDALKVVSASAPANGSVQVNANSTVTYAPAAGYSGSDSFSYTISDGRGGTATANVSVQVNAPAPVFPEAPPGNVAPVASDQSVNTNEDTPVAITLAASDANGDALTYSLVTNPQHGALSGTGNNLTYAPAANYNGADSFTFRADDGFGYSNTATVSISIAPVNDVPTASGQSVSVNEDSSLNVTLSAVDADGDALTYSVSAPLHGSLAGSAPNLTYTPASNYYGPDSFTFKANDGSLDSNEATISITVVAVNDAPAADSQAVTTAEDTPVSITLSASDIEGDLLTYSASSPSHGTLSGSAPNLVYTPAANYFGPDSFTFKANDGQADSNVATVSVTVTPVNDNPISGNDSATTNQDTPVIINVLANDSDIDGDALKVTSVTAPAHGSASVNADSTITYRPATGFSGSDSFSYTISDGNGGSASATVSVTVRFVPSTYALTVSSVDMYGKPTGGLYTVIKQASTTAKTGFTTLSYAGGIGGTYSVTISDYGSTLFDHWDNGSTARARMVALNGDTAITAVFRVPTIKLSPTSGPSGTLISVSGTYFTPGSSVSVTYDGKSVASATANAAGAFSASFAAPALGTGFHTVQATDGNGWKASAKFEDTTPPPPHPLRYLIPKNGIYVALYMYPTGDGAAEWQKVIDAKKAHPSVPIVAAFNPNSGPGTAKDPNFATWVAKLKSAGVIMIGYTHDGYGTRQLADMKADADKYRNWYNADGLFIDEFTNKVGYEQHYKDLTAYVKSTNMKMTMGNPGTDVPKSYVGVVDVLNITEGRGYMPISWLQYCVQCSADQGWHYQNDSLYFSYMRYDIPSLDTAFEVESSKWAGLLYITDGNDSDGRWFHLPLYFNAEVAALDK